MDNKIKYYDDELKPLKNKGFKPTGQSDWWTEDGEIFRTAILSAIAGGLWFSFELSSYKCFLYNYSEDDTLRVHFQPKSFAEVKIIRDALKRVYARDNDKPE